MPTTTINDLSLELYDFFQHAPIGVQLVDADGTTRFVNDTALQLAGEHDPSALLGRHFSVLHAERATVDHLLDDWVGGRTITGLRAAVRRSDGSTQDVVLHSNARTRDGTLELARCFAVPDRGTRPLATAPAPGRAAAALAELPEESRRDLLALLDDAFEHAPVALHIVGPDGLVRRANRLELENLGYEHEPEAYVGHHIAEFHAEQRVIDDMLERLVGGQCLIDYRATLRLRDGRTKPVVIYSSPRIEDGVFINTRCFTFERPAEAVADGPAFDWPRNEELAGAESNDLTAVLKRLAGRRSAEEALGFLAATSTALAAAAGPDETAQAACNLAVPFVADWCQVETDDGSIGCARTDSIDGSDALLRELAERSEADDEAMRAVRIAFVTREGRRGALLLARTAGRPAFGRADLALAEELTRRVTAAIEIHDLRAQLQRVASEQVSA